MTNSFKKGISALVATAILTAPIVAFAGSSANVNVQATVQPKAQATLSLNFDGMNFYGGAGQPDIMANYTKNGAPAPADFVVQSPTEWTVFVAATDLTGYNPTTATNAGPLTSQRLKVMDPMYGNLVGLSGTPTQVMNGPATGPINYWVDFRLDLSQGMTDPMTGMPMYADDAILDSITHSTYFNSTVTFSVTSL